MIGSSSDLFSLLNCKVRELDKCIFDSRDFNRFGVPTVFTKFSPSVNRWNDRMMMGTASVTYKLHIGDDLILNLFAVSNANISNLLVDNGVELIHKIVSFTFTYKGLEYSSLMNEDHLSVKDNDAYVSAYSTLETMCNFIYDKEESLYV